MYESQTVDEARRRIEARNKAAALAWLEQVGSWPSDDAEVREVTRMANRLLGFPSQNPATTDALERFTVAELEAMPTLSVGQADDLKVEQGRFRWWLTRAGRASGETHAIHVEELIPNVGWRTVHKYGRLTNPCRNPAAVTLGQALIALGLSGIGVATLVAGVRLGRGQHA